MTDNVTVKAYEVISSKQQTGKIPDINKNYNHQVVVYVYTPEDSQTHRYFHSLSIDKQVEDFMGTCELKCKYDSDLMKYWEPIRNYCVVYGSNHGTDNVKILFIGRVREVKQEGYELVITLQDYAWKFKQMVTQSYANDNVVGKDGYTIMKLIFAALKIDSWVISPSAKNRLKQVGIDSDGNVTLNKKKVEQMPDLLKRLKSSNPNKAINKWTVYNKVKESELHNIKNINYTLKYEKPTPVMKKIASQGAKGYAPGKSMYGTNYGSQSSNNSSGGGSSNSQSSSGGRNPPNWVCASVKSSSINTAMQSIWKFNRGYTGDYSWARQQIINYAKNSPTTGYPQQAVPCLNTLAKYCTRKDGINAAKLTKQYADSAANAAKIRSSVGNAVNQTIKGATNAYNQAKAAVGHAVNTIVGGVKTVLSWFGI